MWGEVVSIKLLHIYCKTIFPVCVCMKKVLVLFSVLDINFFLYTGYSHTSFLLYFSSITFETSRH